MPSPKKPVRLKVSGVTWKTGFPNRGVNPDAAYQALELIRQKNEGNLDPSVLVSTLKKTKRNVLRKFFEWDDTKAAQEHRLEQARGLIRSVHVTYVEGPKEPMRVYEVSIVKVENEKRRLYRTAEDVLADPDSQVILLERARGELASFRRRYQNLLELADVLRSIDDLLN